MVISAMLNTAACDNVLADRTVKVVLRARLAGVLPNLPEDDLVMGDAGERLFGMEASSAEGVPGVGHAADNLAWLNDLLLQDSPADSAQVRDRELPRSFTDLIRLTMAATCRGFSSPT